MRLVAGIGFSSRATGAEIAALVETTLASAGLPRTQLATFATLDSKAEAPALREAAAQFGVGIAALPKTVLAAHPAAEPSAAALAARNLPSIAEAAAASLGTLLVPKHKSAHATCALARIEGEP